MSYPLRKNKKSYKPDLNSNVEIIEIEDTNDLVNVTTNLLTNHNINYFIHSMAVSDYTVDYVTTASRLASTIDNSNLDTETSIRTNTNNIQDTKISSYDSNTGDVVYSCSCGHNDTLNINNATNVKLQWKVDWPMRWMVEKVTFETGGIDHSASNGSKAVSERVAREIYNFEPPMYIPYNFIGIKGGGAKMSSSTGNVLTITDLLKVYDPNIIWWFYARFDNMHAFDIALDKNIDENQSDLDFFFDLGGTSLGYFSLLEGFRKEFNITVPLNYEKPLRTIDDFYYYIKDNT